MPEMDMTRLHADFAQMRAKQHRLHARHETAFDLKVDALVWRVAELAMGDATAGRSKVRVVSAPTGSGKTNATAALAAAGLVAQDATFTAAFVVEYAEQAEDLYRKLLALLPEHLHGEVVVWTTAHDHGTSPEVAKETYHVEPTRRFSRGDLLAARIAIGTHRKLLGDLERQRDGGLLTCKGQRRSVVFVDETPTLVKLVEVTPKDVWAFRDRVRSTEQDHPWVDVLTAIGTRMERAYMAANGGSQFSTVDLIESPAEVALFNGQTASMLERFCGDTKDPAQRRWAAEQMEDAARFLTAAAEGYVFLYREEPRRFVSYRLEFQPFPGLVLLDATFDLSGMTLLVPEMDRLEPPRVDHQALRLFHLPLPQTFRASAKKLTAKASTAKPYADWIKATVVKNSRPGELVLVVAHKALFDHRYLEAAKDILTAERADKLEHWEGRRVLTMSWGAGVGANWARDAEAVFLFGEFHIPRAAVVGNVLGLRSQRFAGAGDLKDAMTNGLQGSYGDYYDRHLMRWSVQLGARGRMRNLGSNGGCSPMRLYATMALDRLLRLRHEAFPGAPLPVVLGGKPAGSATGQPQAAEATTKVEALMHLLSTTASPVIWFKDVERETGIPSCKVRTILAEPKVAAVVKGFGWALVSRKDWGLTGKGLGLAREGIRRAYPVARAS